MSWLCCVAIQADILYNTICLFNENSNQTNLDFFDAMTIINTIIWIIPQIKIWKLVAIIP